MTSDVRELTDLSTGRSAVQGEVDGVQVTVVTEPHPLRAALSGKAFALVAPCDGFCDDDVWEQVFGPYLAFDGGTSLRVRDVDLGVALEGADPEDPLPDLLVPLTVVDYYWPRARVLVPLARLRSVAILVDPDSGPRVAGDPAPCIHSATPALVNDCLFCFRRWWRAEAVAKGIAL